MSGHLYASDIKMDDEVSSDSISIPLHDTSYFVSFSDKIVGRLYTSQKFTNFSLENDTAGFKLDYSPNTSLNLGVGITYKWFTLNLAYGFAVLNQDTEKGKTEYLDLQFHSYGTKLMMDVFGQFYKGFYTDKPDRRPDESKYIIRPNLKIFEVGVVAQYVFNNKKYSYRSSFMQNEWQKKSAGSFLLGAETYFGVVHDEISIIPEEVDSNLASLQLNSLAFWDLGPTVGYAHTFVVKKHFFFHASYSIGFTFGSTEYYRGATKLKDSGLSPNSALKLALGYNSDKWVLNLLFVTNQVEASRDIKTQSVGINTGNIRLIYAKRFVAGPKAKKVLGIIPFMD